jgi:Fe-S-cluster containining protein
MEKTSRESIAHKIKVTHPLIKPKVPGISKELVIKIKNYLEGEKPKNKFERMKQIYALADAITYEKRDYIVCRKGCAWCCAIPTEILPIEVEYIENNTTWKRSETNYQIVPGSENNVGYCPLLDQQTGTCSVYEYRPYNCRTFVAYDSPEYCQRGYEGEEIDHWVSGGPQNGYGNQGLLYLAIDLVEAELGEKLGLKHKKILDNRVKDIRSYFKGKDNA